MFLPPTTLLSVHLCHMVHCAFGCACTLVCLGGWEERGEGGEGADFDVLIVQCVHKCSTKLELPDCKNLSDTKDLRKVAASKPQL